MNIYKDEIGSKEQRVVLAALAKSVAKPGCLFIEVGSWYGGTTIILGKIAKKNKGRLIAIDWWKGTDGTELLAMAETENIYSHFWERICKEGLEDTVMPLRADSSLVPKFLKEEQADLIFLDGDHRYDSTSKDIQLFLPIVKKRDGILCGHDCEGKIDDFDSSFLEAHKNVDCHETVHCGVVLAVGESFTDYSVDHSIWSVKYSDKKGNWAPTKLKFSGIENKRQLTPPKISSTTTHELIRYGKFVYAVPSSEKDIDITDNAVRNNKKVLRAKSITELEKVAGPIIPLQIKKYSGYNIVEYKNHFYAISHSIGEIHVETLNKSEFQKYLENGQIVVSDSLFSLKKLVSEGNHYLIPPQLLETYKTYNIVKFKNSFYAISVFLGKIDLQNLSNAKMNEHYKKGDILEFDSLQNVKITIDRQVADTYVQVVKEGHRGFNILLYQSKYYAFSQTLGSFDLTKISDSDINMFQKQSECFIGNTLKAVVTLIDNFMYEHFSHDTFDKSVRISELQSKLTESKEESTAIKYKMAQLEESLAKEKTKDNQKINELKNILIKSEEKTIDLITEMGKVHETMAIQLSEKDKKINDFQDLLAESDKKAEALKNNKERLVKEMAERDRRLDELEGLLAESYEKEVVLSTDIKKLQEQLSLDSSEHSRRISALDCKLTDALNEIDRPKPMLVEEGFKGFNIVLYKDKFHAISQVVGPVDISNLESRKINEYKEESKWVSGDTLDEARLCVNKLVRWKYLGELLGISRIKRDQASSCVNVIKRVLTLQFNVKNTVVNYDASLENVEILYDSGKKEPSVSLILLDWSCRESFHILDYLNQQTVPRDEYEVIWIEYYDRRSDQIDLKIKESLRDGRHPYIDKWIRMNYPINTSYHKHRMYNLGILESKAPIISILDSDAMLQPTFIETILKEFEQHERLALHFEQIRNFDQKYYPFNFPSVEEVIGEGCVNATNGIPNVFLNFTARSLNENLDLWHTANYGACLCARREDLIAIGGSDEHLDYLGHVCGPYELTVRLINAGIQDKLHETHFLYHVYHPHQGGGNNDYYGPNNGKGMSLTAMEIPKTGRILPLIENEEIKKLREAQTVPVYSDR